MRAMFTVVYIMLDNRSTNPSRGPQDFIMC